MPDAQRRQFEDIREQVTPIFAAAVITRYRNKKHSDIKIDDLEFFPNNFSRSKSTNSELNVLDLPRFSEWLIFLNRCIEGYLSNIICYKYNNLPARFEI